jgi:hypothetical protein
MAARRSAHLNVRATNVVYGPVEGRPGTFNGLFCHRHSTWLNGAPASAGVGPNSFAVGEGRQEG